MELESSLPCPQQPSTGPYHEKLIQSKFSHRVLKIRFNNIIRFTPWSLNWYLPLRHSTHSFIRGNLPLCMLHALTRKNLSSQAICRKYRPPRMWRSCLWKCTWSSVSPQIFSDILVLCGGPSPQNLIKPQFLAVLTSSIWHEWGRRGMHIGYWWESHNERICRKN
jgi:hypothetical protein